MIKKIISDIIKVKVKNKEMFTSVDISNEVKNSGVWISNSSVSLQLKELFAKKYKRYTTSIIKVIRTEDGKEVSATLYHNKKDDITKYVNKNNKSINPNEFKNINNKPSSQTVVNDDVDKSSSQTVVNDDVDKSSSQTVVNDDVDNKYRKFNFVK